MPEYGLLTPAWLIALPLAWWLPWWMGRRGVDLPRLFRPLAVRHPGLSDSPPGPLESKPELMRWLLLPVLGLLFVALAQPVRYGAPVTREPAPVDLLLLVDVSVSMTLKDYELDGVRVDRLSMAKQLLDRFAADFSGMRLGVIVVGSPSAVWLPLSSDRSLVRHLLARLQLTMAGRNAAIGDALALAAQAFGSARPVVVLISDASYPLGQRSPMEGASILAEAGMTLYSIAIGATRMAQDDSASPGLLHAAADLTLLQRMASRTGGRSFHATDARAMTEALNWIESRHRQEAPPAAGTRLRQPLYQWFLGTALLLLSAWPWWRRGAVGGARGS